MVIPKQVTMASLRLLVIASLLTTVNCAYAQSLHGSKSSVDRMYARAVRNDLDFFRTPKGIYDAVLDSEFVMIGITTDMTLDDVTYPFVLPGTKDFLYAFAKRYHDACGERLVVTSAVRPSTEQPRNASPKSVHPTGMAVDFRKPAGSCLTFLRAELIRLEKQGLIEATEEKHPVHFHVALLRTGSTTVVAASANGDVVLGAPAVPAATAAPSEAASATAAGAGPSMYTVKRGDTLSEIAKKFGSTVTRLKAINKLRGSVLKPGQKLRLR
jgi:LysM repeat protein